MFNRDGDGHDKLLYGDKERYDKLINRDRERNVTYDILINGDTETRSVAKRQRPTQSQTETEKGVRR